MSDDIKYIREKMDIVSDRVGSVEKTLERNTAILDYHIKRTDLLENSVERVTEHVLQVHTLFNAVKWSIGVTAAVAGIVWTVIRLI